MALLRPDDLVLVAILNAPRDLEIARLLGWYRIPVQTAPKTVRGDWLAFYLPGSFGEQRWSVRYLRSERDREIARLLGWYRIPVQTAPKTVRVDWLAFYLPGSFGEQRWSVRYLARVQGHELAGRWRRFAFLYTTGARLLEARSVRDLTLRHGKDRERLWRMLRERARRPAWAGPAR